MHHCIASIISLSIVLTVAYLGKTNSYASRCRPSLKNLRPKIFVGLLKNRLICVVFFKKLAFKVLLKQNCLDPVFYAAVFHFSSRGYYSVCQCFYQLLCNIEWDYMKQKFKKNHFPVHTFRHTTNRSTGVLSLAASCAWRSTESEKMAKKRNKSCKLIAG